MVAITTRAGKGSPLTNAEMDANLNNLNESQTVMGEPMGHADITQSTISFNAGTRTFTITPVGANFVVWCKGEKYTYTTAQTVVIPDTAGLHFIYFSSTGVLSTKMSYFTWDEDAPTSYVYWNATNNEAVYFADERHGVTLDWQTHEYLHRTRGAAIANGFAASGYTTSGDGSADADAQITIEGGTFFDEDMQIDIVSSNTPTANTFQQDLNSPARIPILYLEGSEWRITAPTDFPVKQGTARPQYNLFSGSVWTLVDVTNTDFTCTWILATNNLNYPVVGIISQSNLSTLNNAEASVFEDLDLPGFPSVEFRPLYKLIFQSNSTYSNTPHTRLRGITDLRSISSVGVAPSLISDHGNLSGLTDDDHPQYLSVSDVRPGIASAVKKSLIPSTPVAGGIAYGTADSLDFSVAGTAGQVITSGGASVPTWTTATDANTASAIVKRDASGNFSAGTISGAILRTTSSSGYVKVNDAFMSSSAASTGNWSTNTVWNGSVWTMNGTGGSLYQQYLQNHYFIKHDGASFFATQVEIDQNGFVYSYANGNNPGLMLPYQYYRRNSTSVGLNAATTAQAVFNGATSTSSSISGTVLTVGGTITGTFEVGQVIYGAGVTAGTYITSLGTGTGGAGTYNLSASMTVAATSINAAAGVYLAGDTTYQFELTYVLNKTAGTTSHTVGHRWGGSAGTNNFLYTLEYASTTSALPTGAAATRVTSTSFSNFVMTGAVTAAASTVIVTARGTISVSSDGTFCPLYVLSAAPGGAYTSQIGGYFKIAAIGASGDDVKIGSWV
jgi:hypothetical protein